MIRWLQGFLEHIWRKISLQEESVDLKGKSIPTEPNIHFDSITKVNKTPKNCNIGKNNFIIVVYQQKPLWTLFQCPCGCEKVISLSLQRVHRPHWRVSKNKLGRPTLFPSVWQNKGCCSHFWIKDGKVYWCQNTGTDPVGKQQY